MPLDKLLLILVCIAAGLGALVWGSALLISAAFIHPAVLVVVISLIAGVTYIAWRVIAERVGNAEEDHYDGMKH